MYLLYIDDSGTCDLKEDADYSINGGNSRFFVLSGILIKAQELNNIEPKIESIKNSCLKKTFAEIKHSIPNGELKCHTSCETQYNKICYKKKIANLIKNTDCVVFVTLQDKYYTTSNQIVTNQNDVYRLCFEYLLKSVDTYMYNQKVNDYTISFIDKKDSSSEKDRIIYEAYKAALANTKLYKSFSNRLFSPTINVVYSQYTSGAQLADFIAGSVWAFYESGENKQLKESYKEITKIYGERVYSQNDKKLGFTYCKNFLK